MHLGNEYCRVIGRIGTVHVVTVSGLIRVNILRRQLGVRVVVKTAHFVNGMYLRGIIASTSVPFPRMLSRSVNVSYVLCSISYR